MKKFLMMAVCALALCACNNNASNVNETGVATDSICDTVATSVEYCDTTVILVETVDSVAE